MCYIWWLLYASWFILLWFHRSEFSLIEIHMDSKHQKLCLTWTVSTAKVTSEFFAEKKGNSHPHLQDFTHWLVFFLLQTKTWRLPCVCTLQHPYLQCSSNHKRRNAKYSVLCKMKLGRINRSCMLGVHESWIPQQKLINSVIKLKCLINELNFTRDLNPSTVVPFWRNWGCRLCKHQILAWISDPNWEPISDQRWDNVS